jgi:putative membrane-bound dehydrogenase-like protein
MASSLGLGRVVRRLSSVRWRIAACAVAVGTLASGARAIEAAEVRIEGRTFRIPDGFTIERAAGSPLVDRPITGALDERGYLYIADSSGSNDNVQKQLAEKPHRILRLEDTDRDGIFDKRVVFADKMMFPEGTMWFGDSLYVAAPPSIWKLTDTDGDGVADRRVEWFKGKTLTGCANDLHGPYPGPDGWIYWCKGAFARQTYERPGKPPFSTRASHIFRCRPDGTGIETVMTGGMDNPVDVVFTPSGERVFTTTFFVHPGGGQRDGLIHAIYGGIYGKVHDPIFEPSHKWTGPEVMPVLLHMGPAAPCGLTRYESDAFGQRYQDNLFACYFNLHKVSRHVLTPHEATFTTKDEDFVTSPDLDFHPTDVLEDADGSLLIVDTGGWYKLCCPTSQLHKPDVLGAIYRVRRKDAPRPADPRGLDLDWDAMAPDRLVKLIDDPRPAVRARAIRTLAARGESSLAPLAERLYVPFLGFARSGQQDYSRGAAGRIDCIWAACRIDHPRARALVRQTVGNSMVGRVAAHAAGLWRDKQAVRNLVELLEAGPAPATRVSAEALGRTGDPSAVPFLLEAAGRASDRITEHSITYALIEIGDPGATRRGLESSAARTRRAAMVALDQMDGGGLDAKSVAGLLASDEPILKEAASWIVGRHPEWAGELAGVLGARLARADLAAPERAELERQLGRYAQASPIQRLLAERLRDPSASQAERLSCLAAMSRSGLKAGKVPGEWVGALASALGGRGDADVELIPAVVAAVRSLPIARNGNGTGDLSSRLLRIAEDAANPPGLRLDAMAAVPGGLDKPDPKLFDFLMSQIGPDRPVAARTTAADVLARARLAPGPLDRLVDAMATAGPVEADRLLTAFEQSTDEALGLKLVDVLSRSPVLTSLRIDALKAHLAKYDAAVRARAEERLYARLNADAAQQKAQLERMLAALSAGDVRRGQLVFHSEKAACYSCHAIGYRGGNVGPDLTKIGSVRSDRDLLESILFPSASLVRSFEPVAVAMQDGKVYNGLIRGENADELILATGVNQEARIPRREIEEMRPSAVSIMPAGFDQQLTPQELADLVAFLKACR